MCETVVYVNPIVFKYPKRYVYGCEAESMQLYVLLLNLGVHIDGFISSKDSGLILYNKTVFDETVCDGESLVLIPDGLTFVNCDINTCNEVVLLNPILYNRAVYIYGIGQNGKVIKDYLTDKGIFISGFFDKKAVDSDKELLLDSVTVKEPESIELLDENSVIIIAAFNSEHLRNELEDKYSYNGCYVCDNFFTKTYRLVLMDKVIRYDLTEDIYNFVFYFSNNKDKMPVIYGANEYGIKLANMLKLLDINVSFFIDDDKGLSVDNYKVVEVEDVLYENAFIIITKEDVKSAHKRLMELGLRYAIDYARAYPFRVDKYFERANILDVNLGYTYIGRQGLPGFTILGNDDKDDYRIVVLGGSTSDVDLFAFKSWPELLYEKLSKDKNVTIYAGAVAGYTSAQELVKLQRDVVSLKPDLVVVFDGFNDTIKDDNTPFAHDYLKNSFKLLSDLYKDNYSLYMGDENDIKKVSYGLDCKCNNVEFWLRNIRMMKSICEEYGIGFLSFLQPMLQTKEMKNGSEASWMKMADVFYTEGRKACPRLFRKWAQNNYYEYICDCSDIFDNVSDIYIDDIHVNEAGNGIIADVIYNKLLSYWRV